MGKKQQVFSINGLQTMDTGFNTDYLILSRDYNNTAFDFQYRMSIQNFITQFAGGGGTSSILTGGVLNPATNILTLISSASPSVNVDLSSLAGSITSGNVIIGTGVTGDTIRLQNGINFNDIILWNGATWTIQNASVLQDHDWYTVGGIVAPTSITDNIYHTGSVVIGDINPVGTNKLTVLGDSHLRGTTFLRSNTSGGLLFAAQDNGLVSIGDVGNTFGQARTNYTILGNIEHYTSNTLRISTISTGETLYSTLTANTIVNIGGTGLSLNNTSVRFYNTTNYVGLSAGAGTTTQNYTLPLDLPVLNNSLLVSSITGVMSWLSPNLPITIDVTDVVSGTNNDILFVQAGKLSQDNLFVFNPTTNQLGVNTATPRTSLTVEGLISTNIAFTNVSTTLTTSKLLVDTSSGNITITLPTAAGIDGAEVVIKKISVDTNSVNIIGDSGQLVEGIATLFLYTQNESVKLTAFNNAWYII